MAHPSMCRRLKELRLATRGRKGASGFAGELGLGYSTYHNYEVDRVPPADIVAKAAEITGCGRLWLLHGTGEMFPMTAEEYHEGMRGIFADLSLASIDELLAELKRRSAPPPRIEPTIEVVTSAELKAHMLKMERGDVSERYTAVPLLADAAAAGPGREIHEADIESYALIYKKWVKGPGPWSCIRVTGDSMAPELPDRSIVAVNHAARGRDDVNGRIAAVRYQDGVTVKYVDVYETGLMLRPTNIPKHSPGFIPADEAEGAVIGRIDWFWAFIGGPNDDKGD